MSDYQGIFESVKRAIPERIAIWGAAESGIKCFEWLESIGKEKNVCFFIDNDPEKQGQYLLRKSVYNENILAEQKGISIFICSAAFTAISKQIEEKYPLNDQYFFIRFQNPYQKSLTQTKRNVIEEYDTSDQYTNNFLKLYFSCKENNNTLLLPVNSLSPLERELFKVVYPYWKSDKEVDLNIFDTLSFVDAGAYEGDTITDLLSRYDARFSKIFAFEPDPENFSKLNHLCHSKEMNTHIQLFSCGLSDQNQDVFLSNPGTLVGRIEESGTVPTKTITLDEVGITVTGKLCIKMDIEGSELAALKGAKETIKKYKPELAICIYHQAADIYEIPNYIHSLVPEYRCIIRSGIHTVCYASVER